MECNAVAAAAIWCTRAVSSKCCLEAGGNCSPVRADRIRMHVIIIQLAGGGGNHNSSSTFGTRWTEKNSMTLVFGLLEMACWLVIVGNYMDRILVLKRFWGEQTVGRPPVTVADISTLPGI